MPTILHTAIAIEGLGCSIAQSGVLWRAANNQDVIVRETQGAVHRGVMKAALVYACMGAPPWRAIGHAMASNSMDIVDALDDRISIMSSNYHQQFPVAAHGIWAVISPRRR